MVPRIPRPSFRVLVIQYTQRCGIGVWFTRLALYTCTILGRAYGTPNVTKLNDDFFPLYDDFLQLYMTTFEEVVVFHQEVAI